MSPAEGAVVSFTRGTLVSMSGGESGSLAAGVGGLSAAGEDASIREAQATGGGKEESSKSGSGESD